MWEGAHPWSPLEPNVVDVIFFNKGFGSYPFTLRKYCHFFKKHLFYGGTNCFLCMDCARFVCLSLENDTGIFIRKGENPNMYTLYVNFINTVQCSTFTQEINEYCDSWNTIIKLSCSCCLQLFIILSCTIAVGTNLSQFICIGRFTAVSFQVLGHMKTILVLILGFIFFGKEGLNLHVVLGMIVAIAGMVWYGNASSKPGGKERRSFSLPKTQDYSSLPVSSEPDPKA